MMLNNNDESKDPTIAEFFANKNIFITGGTGFLGTVLIESLLSSTPDIGTIYVLVRDKYGSDANERIQRLLSKQVRTAKCSRFFTFTLNYMQSYSCPAWHFNSQFRFSMDIPRRIARRWCQLSA